MTIDEKLTKIGFVLDKDVYVYKNSITIIEDEEGNVTEKEEPIYKGNTIKERLKARAKNIERHDFVCARCGITIPFGERLSALGPDGDGTITVCENCSDI